MSKIKIKNKKIFKNKLDVWLKYGELEKYLAIKKRLVNKTIYMPNKKYDLSCVNKSYVQNCKLIIISLFVSFNYENKNIIYRNSIFLGNIYGEYDVYVSNYKNRKKFKNKRLK